MSDQVCRVVGCVAFAAPEPRRPSTIWLRGICAIHQRFPEDELRALLKREAGLVAPLKSAVVGIEYVREDGTGYGYDHDGNYYEVPA